MYHGAELAQGVEGAQEHGLQLPLLPGVSRVVEQLARPVQRTGKLGAFQACIDSIEKAGNIGTC